MKRTKVVLAAASLILAGISIAATKPMRAFSNAYIQLYTANGVNHDGCIATITPCVPGSAALCTETNSTSPTTVYVNKASNNVTCLNLFRRVD